MTRGGQLQQRSLRISISLIGSTTPPFHSLLFVLLDALAFVVAPAQAELRRSVALLCATVHAAVTTDLPCIQTLKLWRANEKSGLQQGTP